MAPAEQGHEQLLDHLLLADDDPADLVGHVAVSAGQVEDGLCFRRRQFPGVSATGPNGGNNIRGGAGVGLVGVGHQRRDLKRLEQGQVERLF
jgi:hypothetical protein